MSLFSVNILLLAESVTFTVYSLRLVITIEKTIMPHLSIVLDNFGLCLYNIDTGPYAGIPKGGLHEQILKTKSITYGFFIPSTTV